MREVPSTIWNLWDNGGPYFGEDGAPHSRVTVEQTWRLNTSRAAGNFKKLPVRWWQREDNSQVETEVPNIGQIQIDRSLDSDAATCSITLANQWHFNNGEVTREGELGQPGYFTFSRGDSSEAAARWDQAANDWNGVLIPNALLRTYQGYGGKDKTVDDAIADGNILLTGVWLIDTVSVQTDGHITLQCRDMAKLLIDQFIFPPLTPHGWYPLTYCRWYHQTGSNPQVIYGHLAEDSFLRAGTLRYAKSTGDEDGNNTAELGHRPTHALDQTTATEWLSIGRDQPTDWIYYEVTVSERINSLFCDGNLGGYQCYISIMEGGVWQGDNTIPAPAGYNIAYISQSGADSNENVGAITAKIYEAQRVRFTFTHLARTDLEGLTYRVAFEEISVGRIESGLPTKNINGMAVIPNNNGYWLVGNDGGVFSIGRGIHFYGSSGGGSTTNAWTNMSSTSTGLGYWTLREDGRVFNFGDAGHFGDARTLALSAPIFDMGRTPTNGGYWLLGADGGVFTYGDADYFGNGTAVTGHGFAMAFAEKPNGTGYWILWSDGHVTPKGSATSHGDAPTSTTATGITSTKTGNGYWITDISGAVFAHGDADYHGGANGLNLADPVTDIVRSSTTAQDGYYLVAGDGGVFAYGDAHFWGSLPARNEWDVRKTGNYKDYTDIIKDLLLWSGWFLYDPVIAGTASPHVFGNLETTGIYDSSLSTDVKTGRGEGCLPEDVFDKKPVIDAISQLKEIVGFNFWIDEEGGARFELPNWYTPGNRIMDDGSHTTFVPVIDEATNLTDYSIDYTDAPVRSEIIIASADPDEHFSDTKTSRLTVSEMAPESTDLLRGMVKPAMWVNETFQNQTELDIMARRVATQILFNQRSATVTCAFNPAIQINDQVQIYERQTAETYVHYVRGVQISHDLEAGKMSMQLTTHWLGSGNNFIISTWNTP